MAKDRRVPHLLYLRRKRAELEACNRRSVQGQRIRVCLQGTLPKPESQSLSSAEVFLPSGDSAGSMAQRGLVGSKGACPKRATPLGPDQVNVLLLFLRPDCLHAHSDAVGIFPFFIEHPKSTTETSSYPSAVRVKLSFVPNPCLWVQIMFLDIHTRSPSFVNIF
jgi:hypothetical protein